MKWRVLISCLQLQESVDDYRGLFAERGIQIDLPKVFQQLSEAELMEIIDRYDGVIAGDDHFTSRVLEKATRLKTIARWGVGVDSVDLDAAERLGIRVTNTPGAFADEVADVVMGYIIMLARQLHKIDQAVRRGEWKKILGVSLPGKKLGVIGVGSIGRAVVYRGVAMGMTVVGYDQAPIPKSFVEETGLIPVGLNTLFAESDFITLNCNLTSSNYHLLGARQFQMMKNGVYIVNASRGPLIDETSLIQALKEGKVAGAALDVFESEPLPPESGLRQFDSCIFGTHNSSNTREAVLRVNEASIANLLNALEEPGN